MTLESITADEWTQEHQHKADVSLARRFIGTVADVWEEEPSEVKYAGASEICAVERGCCLGGCRHARHTTHGARRTTHARV